MYARKFLLSTTKILCAMKSIHDTSFVAANIIKKSCKDQDPYLAQSLVFAVPFTAIYSLPLTCMTILGSPITIPIIFYNINKGEGYKNMSFYELQNALPNMVLDIALGFKRERNTWKTLFD